MNLTYDFYNNKNNLLFHFEHIEKEEIYINVWNNKKNSCYYVIYSASDEFIFYLVFPFKSYNKSDIEKIYQDMLSTIYLYELYKIECI